MEAAYEERRKIEDEFDGPGPVPVIDVKVGDYLIIPEGFVHCYDPYRYLPPDPISGIGQARKNIPEMNALILDRIDGLWNGSFEMDSYFLVEDENEKEMLVRINYYLARENEKGGAF